MYANTNVMNVENRGELAMVDRPQPSMGQIPGKLFMSFARAGFAPERRDVLRDYATHYRRAYLSLAAIPRYLTLRAHWERGWLPAKGVGRVCVLQTAVSGDRRAAPKGQQEPYMQRFQ